MGRTRPIEGMASRLATLPGEQVALLSLVVLIGIFLFAILAPLVSHFTGFTLLRQSPR